MKKIKSWMVVASTLVAMSLSANSSPITGRIWNYNIITVNVTKHFGIITIPGFKYEYLRYFNGERVKSKGTLVYEFFAGPYFIAHSGKVRLMIPIVYHYMCFPSTPKNSNFSYNYNVDIFPSFLYKMKKSMLQWRVFFHNTLYSSFYKNVASIKENKRGYSLLLKLRMRYSYWISKKFALSVGDELLYGLVQNNGLPAKTGPGFTEKGIDANRLIAGFVMRLGPNLKISPYYLYENTYAEDEATSRKKLTFTSHYLFLLVSYNLNL